MGLLINGRWHDQWYDTAAQGGRFERDTARFRNWVTADGKAGPSGEAGFAAESGRYHLYVSYACPWAHRTLIMRALKGLEPMISVDVVHPLMLENGWTFDRGFDGATGDSLFGSGYLHQLYTRAQPDANGRVTVPLLWDKKRQTIVSNESSEIIRMFNTAFDAEGAAEGDYYPARLKAEIDDWNGLIYRSVNNGVYRAGFATSQSAYDDAVHELFDVLGHLERHLSGQRYLVGNSLTEADIRLFTTLVRFDPVYVSHFKCDLHRIQDYPALSGYLRDLYQRPAFRSTTRFDHIREHYYRSHKGINPSGVIPVGPEFDLDAPHGRGELGDE
ncbi:glutathione-dependent reductase [Marinobacterium zhoushanense]|uniref:Glutathione-dependent reductase n=1 Tax=Marinobacterium zhoushanense TaxID=1679163 RepID=A0ABQ1K0M6_9GAMM|nr:glutathione S-transferase family protein [Marinobacterium zhoushanense]GGB80587.1 glutathione-dependent reductase [Marinobacterium zhoushanense]